MSQTTQRQLRYIQVDELQTHDHARDIREETVSEIKDRIEADEFNPAKPLRVFKTSDGYIVGDGNHRLKALRQLDFDSTVPCVVEPTTNPEYAEVVEVSAKSNRDEATFAEDDLFDNLDRIERLSDNHTQAEVAEVLGEGWSRSKVNNYTLLISEVDTGVLSLARSHQDGRVSSDDTAVSFSEYWFRTSGLYDLNRDGVEEYALPDEDEPKHSQMRVMEWYIGDENGDVSKNKLHRKVNDVKEVCELLDQLNEELNSGVDDDKREELREGIVKGEYTPDTLPGAIENANQNAQDRVEFGTDAITGLKTIEEDRIDCVVTDPPYGVEYDSHRDTERPDFPDEEAATFELLDDVFAELKRVCKANAHIYVFFAMKRYGAVRKIAEQYFDVTATPLVWAKNNHVPTRDAERGFEKMYAHQYEAILVCRMPNGDKRRLNGGVSPNVLEYDRPEGDDRWHDAQKPRSLLEELITNSTGKRETVLDPFAGSGSTPLAAAETGRHYVGFEQKEKYESDFARKIREVQADD